MSQEARSPKAGEVVEEFFRRLQQTDAAQLGLMLWLKYNLLAERASRSFKRVFVGYANLLENWRSEVLRINDALALSLRPDGPAIEAFLMRDLRNHDVTNLKLEIGHVPYLQELASEFAKAARGSSLDSALLDRAFGEITTYERLISTALVDALARLPTGDRNNLAGM